MRAAKAAALLSTGSDPAGSKTEAAIGKTITDPDTASEACNSEEARVLSGHNVASC